MFMKIDLCRFESKKTTMKDLWTLSKWLMCRKHRKELGELYIKGDLWYSLAAIYVA